jgi:hypothetical protein
MGVCMYVCEWVYTCIPHTVPLLFACLALMLASCGEGTDFASRGSMVYVHVCLYVGFMYACMWVSCVPVCGFHVNVCLYVGLMCTYACMWVSCMPVCGFHVHVCLYVGFMYACASILCMCKICEYAHHIMHHTCMYTYTATFGACFGAPCASRHTHTHVP